MKNVKFVYFTNPVQVRTKNTTKPMHVVSNDRFKLEMKQNFLHIEVDGILTIVPVHNISSIQLEELPDAPAER